MNAKSKGIILKRKKVSGSDVVIDVFFEEFGKKSLYIKGARHPKSKFSASTELMTEGLFSIYLKKGLSTLLDVDILNSFSKSKNSTAKLFLASYFLEYIDKLFKEEIVDKRIYLMLVLVLNFLEYESDDKMPLLRAVFLIKLLQNTGVFPNLENCSSCMTGKSLVYFDFVQGGLTCSSCKRNNHLNFVAREDLIKFMQRVKRLSYKDLRNESFAKKTLDDAIKVSEIYLKESFNIYEIKSSKMLEIL